MYHEVLFGEIRLDLMANVLKIEHSTFFLEMMNF